MVRVVLLSEGPGEGARGLPPAPGSPLPEESLGAAHLLVRRCFELDASIPPGAVRFDAPLRVRGNLGRLPRGSELLQRQTLRQLLTWLRPDLRPDVSIVLVDADDAPQRRQMVEEMVSGLILSPVVAVAIREFEAWLIADEVAVSKVTGTSHPTCPEPESMRPRQAKELLTQWLSGIQDRPGWQLRREIVLGCDLDHVGRRCAAFGRFRKELVRAAGR